MWQHIQLRTKNMTFHGGVFGFCILSCIVTIITGFWGLYTFLRATPKTSIMFPVYRAFIESTTMTFNIFNYTLPFVAFCYDHSLKKIIDVEEKAIFVVLKLFTMVYYLGVYVLALQ